MSSEPIPTWCFALVVVRFGHRFLLVHERKHGQRWYLPAGRVEAGETFIEAAIRETYEEAGIDIAIEGILRVEHTPIPEGARIRVLFVAHPISDRPPKREPDNESLEAAWVSMDELEQFPLRGDEVRALFEQVTEGAPIYPLSLFQFEGES